MPETTTTTITRLYNYNYRQGLSNCSGRQKFSDLPKIPESSHAAGVVQWARNRRNPVINCHNS